MTAVAPDKTLVINHVIYLTPEERRILLKEKKPVQVVGVSVPVWFNASLPTGYRINLPQPKIMAEWTGMEEQEPKGPDCKKLGDPEDGGSGWLLYKQFQTLKQDDRILQILHYIELRDIEYYWNTVKMKDSIAATEPSAC